MRTDTVNQHLRKPRFSPTFLHKDICKPIAFTVDQVLSASYLLASLYGSSWTHMSSVSMKIWQDCPSVQRILLQLLFKRTGALGLRGIMQCAYNRRTDERHIETYESAFASSQKPFPYFPPPPQKPMVSRRSRGRAGGRCCAFLGDRQRLGWGASHSET